MNAVLRCRHEGVRICIILATKTCLLVLLVCRRTLVAICTNGALDATQGSDRYVEQRDHETKYDAKTVDHSRSQQPIGSGR